ncbi:hypothetical protein DVA67_016215 [Solirubrobacter sp. CPCC 204708]|uniref:DUF1857 family protein n=1 Tax=Solirubrobacter deserti TaxID=2282478 RepID=A0ABT4RNZ1_9ACTN|nr:hypothetical protein [Solirubrobacter deserti]MBE2317529.1 hypothetical protein [Solirubrobacter deserti]MDA0140295.1 hypothetical protein [Solirubrobacter deserti]
MPPSSRMADLADWTVELTTGTEHFEAGEIALRVRHGGSVEVDHRRAGDHRRYTGLLDADELARFAEAMRETGIDTLVSTRTEWATGEDTLRVEVRDGDAPVHRAEIPAGERFDDERVGRVLRAYDEVVERVTEGRLPYGPAAY